MSSTLFNTLNQAQQEAVQHQEGPAIVLAGAGSGKTTVLTARVQWLLENSTTSAENIMVVTFTNKAGKEIRHRILTHTHQDMPFVGTFHSLSARILRKEGYYIGLNPNFVIYDTDDQMALIKALYKKEGANVKEYHPRAVLSAISTAKNEALSVKEYQYQATGNFREFVAKIYKLYQGALHEAQAVDFDDLLLHTYRLLSQYQEVRERYQTQFSHVLVDEYQDTNRVQYLLTKILAHPHNNLYVVGDFSQSIYAWRGADYRNMLLLKSEFPAIKEYRLEQNYRSCQTILDAATAVISYNTSHPILSLWTEQAAGNQITCIQATDEMDEAFKVARVLKQNHTQIPYSEMAVLYRTNAQSRALEEALISHHIPYQLIGGTKFYERKEVKDIIAYLRYILNLDDSVSYERILKLGVRRAKVLQDWLTIPAAQHILTQPPAQIIKDILEVTRYVDIYKKQDTPENASRIENIRELVNVATQFSTVTQFLENVALIQDTQFSDTSVFQETVSNCVSLMSLHTAKGLEFELVCMVGMEEGLFPHSRSQMNPQELEEERRLCYVGITRAKQRLYISHAKQRFQYGTRMNSIRSRFIQDIPKELVTFEGYTTHQSEYGNSGDKRVYVPLDNDLLEGVLNGEIDARKLIDF